MKRKIRRLINETAWSLMICAGFALALGIAIPGVTTEMVQLALSMFLFGASFDVLQKFI